MMVFKNKKILFVCPVFYNYHELIIEKLKEKGAEVTFIPERNYTILFSIINNFFPKLMSRFQIHHYFRFFKKIKSERFDYLFVIRGYMLPAQFIYEIEKINSNIIKLMYQWDSNQNNEYFSKVSLFNKVFSFDYEDCKLHPKINYLPLFYTDDVKALQNFIIDKKYDFLFFGVYLKERYNEALHFKKKSELNNWNSYIYIYIPLSTYIKEKIKGVKFDNTILFINFLKRKDYLKILSESKAIIDVSSNSQSGLAMRIIEALALNKLIFTSNKFIVNDRLINQEIIFDISLINNLDFNFCNYHANSIKSDIIDLNEWLDKIFFT